MKAARNYQRKCKSCGQKLVKNGIEHGKQRWRCLRCGTSRVISRNDTGVRNRARLKQDYLTHKDTASDTAKRLGRNRTTLWRQQKDIPIRALRPPIEATLPYIVIDAKYLKPDVVGIAMSSQKVLRWRYGRYESTTFWSALLLELPTPSAIVTDGQKGILGAIRNVFEDIIVQRCHFHIQMNIRQKLTLNPKTCAGQDLKQLMHWLVHIKNEDQMSLFVATFSLLEEEYADFLKQRTVIAKPTSKKKWFYTHSRVRSAYRQIRKLIDDGELFAYVMYPYLKLPTTTNRIEGGINSRLDELLRSHRGIPPWQKKAIVDAFLNTKV